MPTKLREKVKKIINTYGQEKEGLSCSQGGGKLEKKNIHSWSLPI